MLKQLHEAILLSDPLIGNLVFIAVFIVMSILAKPLGQRLGQKLRQKENPQWKNSHPTE